MEPNGVTPELALRAYEAIIYYAAWIFPAVAYVAMLSYLVFVSRECSSFAAPEAESGHRTWADRGCVRSQSEPLSGPEGHNLVVPSIPAVLDRL